MWGFRLSWFVTFVPGPDFLPEPWNGRVKEISGIHKVGEELNITLAGG